MLKIRLSMGGVRKRPVYKIVIADSRAARDGRFIEKIGSFNPLLPKENKERISVEADRVKHWISKGAKPTLRVSRILGEAETQGYLKSACNNFTRNDLGIKFWQTSRGSFTSGFVAELETTGRLYRLEVDLVRRRGRPGRI